MGKSLPSNAGDAERRVRSLGQEGPLEKEVGEKGSIPGSGRSPGEGSG